MIAVFLVVGCREESRAIPNRGPLRPAPRLRVEPTVHDIGTIAEGARIERSFQLRNTGNAELRLEAVAPAFGCAANRHAPTTIAPGGTHELRVACDTEGRAGKYRVSLELRSNDPEQPMRNVELSGSVEPLLAFEPFLLELVTDFGKAARREARLKGTERDHARLRVLEASDPGIRVEVLAAERNVAGLAIETRADRVGRGSGRVLVATGLKAPSEIALSYSWNVRGNLRVDPERPYVNLRDPGRKLSRLAIESSRHDFVLHAVDVLDGPFTARFERLPKAPGYLVEVVVREEDVRRETRGALGTLRLTSNDPAEPHKDVSIFAFGKLRKSEE